MKPDVLRVLAAASSPPEPHRRRRRRQYLHQAAKGDVEEREQHRAPLWESDGVGDATFHDANQTFPSPADDPLTAHSIQRNITVRGLV